VRTGKTLAGRRRKRRGSELAAEDGRDAGGEEERAVPSPSSEGEGEATRVLLRLRAPCLVRSSLVFWWLLRVSGLVGWFGDEGSCSCRVVLGFRSCLPPDAGPFANYVYFFLFSFCILFCVFTFSLSLSSNKFHVFHQCIIIVQWCFTKVCM
jgi:hypothetical protein